MKSNFLFSLSLLTLFSHSPSQIWAKTSFETDTSGEHIKAIRSLNSKLSPHDETMKNLIITQDQKNAVLNNIDKILEKKNETIFEYMKLTKALQSKVYKMSLTDRLKSEMKKRELSGTIEESSSSLASLKGSIVEKDLKIQYLQKLLKNQNTQLSMEVKKLNFKIKRLTQTHNTLPNGFDPSYLKLESKHHEVLRTYQNKLHENQQTIAEFKKKFKKNTNYNMLIKENTELASNLKNSQLELSSYKKSYEEMQSKYLTKVNEYKKLETFTNNMQDEFNIQLTTLKSKYAKVMENNSKASRLPASVVSHESPKVEKVNFNLKKENLGNLIHVDPQHMKLVLDETIFYKRGTTAISEDSALRMKSILSVYTKEIFSNEKLKERLLKVQFIGHSSPIYQGQFVDPINASKESYDINMAVSINRAQTLVESIFSNKFGDFPYKNEIRSKIVVSGKSFSEPLMRQRGPASQNRVSCGEYDCENSQRVEILFEFEKENK
jgi:hypothetical protein